MIFYDKMSARRNATLHIQIRLTDVPATPPEDYARIGGAVVRVFHAEIPLEFEAPVSFVVWVCSKGKEPTGPAYVYHENLLHMGYVEAFLNGKPPNYHLVGYEFTLIGEPSDEPMLTVGEPSDVLRREAAEDMLSRPRPLAVSGQRPAAAKKWWQVWKS
jgi:hypothetical protein